jgi:hypothetical protein
MTTTLVERLLDYASPIMGGSEIAKEAADRIEELERQLAERDAEIAKWKSAFKVEQKVADRETQQAFKYGWQIALLRKALKTAIKDVEQIYGDVIGSYDNSELTASNCATAVRQVAEQALASIDDSKLLGGCVLCDAEPVAWQWLDTGTFRKNLPKQAEIGAWTPLYAWRKP